MPEPDCPRTEHIEDELSKAEGDAAWHELVAHLDVCPACRRKAQSGALGADLADDLFWAQAVRAEASVDVNAPLARLNEVLTDYEIIREIGRGGMGIVFEARQTKLNRRVALKVLPALLGAVRPDAIPRFRREAELAASLKHSNIIAVHDFGEVDGTLYYAMELIEGRTLRDVLREIEETSAMDVVLGRSCENPFSHARPPESLPASPSGDRGARTDSRTRNSRTGNPKSDRAYFRRAAEWIADVADALHYAHEMGVIHRDIKPSNLLLARDGRIMVSDFGLARGSKTETVTGPRALLGTCRYMSPEQVEEVRGPIGRTTDVYALGATLYELLALRPMFGSIDDHEVLNQVLHVEPAPPRRFVHQAPRDLETICLKAIEKRPDARYASAKEMADDLRRWLLDLPIAARRSSPAARAWKFVRRRKVAVLAITSLALLMGASIFGFAMSQRWKADALAHKGRADSREVEARIVAIKRDVDEGRLPDALTAIKALRAVHPDDPEVRVTHARILQQLDRGEEAIADLTAFLALCPDCARVHFMLSVLYHDAHDDQQAAFHGALAEKGLEANTGKYYLLRANAEPDPAAAISWLDRGVAADPHEIGCILERTRLNEKLRRYDAMIADAQRAVAMRPNWDLSYGYFGLALMKADRYIEALAALNRAIELRSDDANWWTGRAHAKTNLKQLDGALFDAKRAVELKPDYAQAYACRGRVRAELGDTAAGLTDCAKAIELQPDNPELYLGRLLLYTRIGDWERVHLDACHVVELRPLDPRGYACRAESYLHRSLYDQAVADYSRAIELDPNNRASIHDRGTCYLRMGQLESAIADYSESIRQQPDHTMSYLNRALAYWRLARVVEAVADLTRVIELGEDVLQATKWRAYAFVDIGWYERAIADYTFIIEQEPDNTNARLRRGMSHELLGNQKDAIADYQHVSAAGGLDAWQGSVWKHFAQPAGSTEPVSSGASPESQRSETAWSSRVIGFAAGNTGADQLIAATANDNERAEAHYYVGRAALQAGDAEAAAQAFERCTQLQRDIPEMNFAKALLRQLRNPSPVATTLTNP